MRSLLTIHNIHCTKHRRSLASCDIELAVVNCIQCHEWKVDCWIRPLTKVCGCFGAEPPTRPVYTLRIRTLSPDPLLYLRAYVFCGCSHTKLSPDSITYKLSNESNLTILIEMGRYANFTIRLKPNVWRTYKQQQQQRRIADKVVLYVRILIIIL